MKLFFTLMSVIISSNTWAALIKTAQKGDWNSTSTWVGGIIPQTGDSIWINHYDTVTVSANVTLGANTILVVDTSSSLVINPGRRINMGAGSRFYLRGSTSQVRSGSGGGSAALITINGSDVWSAGVQGTIFGPTCLPSGSVPWCGSVTLPVEYSFWNVSTCGTSVCLSWATSTEINNSHFIVLRTTDLHHYEEIAYIKGAGNSLIEQHYTFTDADVVPGVTYYYQLAQTDFNGDVHYSQIRATETDLAKGVSVFPNPALSHVHLRLNGFELHEHITLILTDSYGNSLFKQQLQATDYSIEVDETIRAKGLVYIQLISSSGDVIYQHKVVIK